MSAYKTSIISGRMSDQDNSVRSMASHAFGMLIQLMPLETITPLPPQIPAELTESVEEQRSFLNQLLNPKCIPDFKLSIKINAELRSYQQVLIACVKEFNWFLSTGWSG